MKISEQLKQYHNRIWLRRLPLPVIVIIVVVALVNAGVWAGVGIVLHYHPALVSTAVLSYTLGLRHALDADHISAIDVMTRRLVAEGQRPVSVGTWFSLGHSTIVVITSIVVAATATSISQRFNSFSKVGGIIGTSVSAGFLLLLGILNAYIFIKLYRELHRVIRASNAERKEFKIEGKGCLFWVLKRLFKMIDRSWKMYPLGVMFGLGFDTSSEVALLGIASIQGAKGTSIWLILIFPVLFTAGMALLDTLDGALMLILYTSSQYASDPLAILYYSLILTAVTVLVALVIGVLQLLALVLNVASPTGKFWEGVAVAGDHYDVIGGGICGSFVIFGALSVILYKPWRRRVDRYRQSLTRFEPEQADLCILEGAEKKIEEASHSEQTQKEVGKAVENQKARNQDTLDIERI